MGNIREHADAYLAGNIDFQTFERQLYDMTNDMADSSKDHQLAFALRQMATNQSFAGSPEEDFKVKLRATLGEQKVA